MTVRVDLAREAEEVTGQLESAISDASLDEKRVDELADRICDLRGRQFKRLVRSVLLVRKNTHTGAAAEVE